MVRRSRNSHQLKVEAHPHRVEIPDAEVRPYLERVMEAAQRLSGGRVYTWLPSRPWPPVKVFAFQEAAHRDAFAAWLAENLQGVTPVRRRCAAGA
jgi:hypothetical protein